MNSFKKIFYFSLVFVLFPFFLSSLLSVTVDDFESAERVVANDPYSPTNFPANNLGGYWFCSQEGSSFSEGSNTIISLMEITSNGVDSTTNSLHFHYLLGVSSVSNDEMAFFETGTGLDSNEQEQDLSTNAIDFYVKGNQNRTMRVVLIPSNTKASSKYNYDLYTASFEVTTNWRRQTLKFNEDTFRQGGWGSTVSFSEAIQEVVSIGWKEEGPTSGSRISKDFWLDQIQLVSSNVKITPVAQLISPLKHVTFYNSTNKVELEWSDESGSGVNLYKLELSADKNFSTFVSGYPKELTSNTFLSTNLALGNFYWRVRCSTNNGGYWGNVSDTYHFYISAMSMHGQAIDLFEDNEPIVDPDPYHTNSVFPRDDMNGGMFCVDDTTNTDGGKVFTHATNSEILLFEITSNEGAVSTTHSLHFEYLLGTEDNSGEWSYCQIHMRFSSNGSQTFNLTNKGFDFWIKATGEGADGSTNRFCLVPPDDRAGPNYNFDFYYAPIVLSSNWQHYVLNVDTNTFHQGGWGTHVDSQTAFTEVCGIAWNQPGTLEQTHRLHQNMWVDQIFLLDSATRIPVITNLSAEQDLSSDKVVITYKGIDLDNDSCMYVLSEYSTNHIDWYPMTPATNDSRHDKPPLSFSSSGTNLAFIWDATSDLPQPYCDKTVWIRLQVDDSHVSGTIYESSPFIYNSYPVNPTNIIISEVMLYPDQGDDWNAQWMEVYNKGDTCITINPNWVIGDLGGTHHSFPFTNGNLLIPPKSFAVFSEILLAEYTSDFEEIWGDNSVEWGDATNENYPALSYERVLSFDRYNPEGIFIQYKPTGYINAVLITNVVQGHTWELKRPTWRASSDTNSPSDVVTSHNWNICEVRGDTNGYPLSTDFGTPGKTNSQWTTSLPPIISNIVAIQTNDGSGKVIIRYTGIDPDDDNCTYVLAQYSRDNISWSNMTIASDSRHTSSPMQFTTLGATITYIWDSKVDLPNIYDGTVWVRFQVNDGMNDSAISNSSAFLVDNESPTPPNLVSPVSNILTNNTSLTFTWNASTDGSGSIDHYVIEVDNTSSAFGNIEKTSNVSGLSATFTLTEGIKYWRVRAYDATGNVSGYEGWTVTIDTNAPNAPSLISPYSNSTTSNNAPTFVWQSVSDSSGIDYYEIVIDSTNTNSVTSTNYTSTSLSDGTHTWQVRVVDGAENVGAFSVQWAVTVDTTGPNAPGLISPASNSTTSDSTPTFVWQSVSDSSGIDYYELTIDGNITNTLTTNYTPVTSLTNGNHTWRVRAVDGVGNVGDYSVQWILTVDTAGPSAPALISPSSNSTTSDSTPTFVWNSVSDSSGIDYYEITIDGNGTNIVGTNYTLGNALTEGNHIWRVRAVDGVGNVGSYSVLWNVVVDTTGPNAPALVSPASNSTTSDSTPMVVWQSVSDANYYEIVIDSTNTNSVTVTNLAVSNLLDGSHTWQVRAVDGVGNVGAFSVQWIFTIDTIPPDVVSLQTPFSNSTVATTTITFTWNPTSDATTSVSNYIIEIDDNSNFSNVNYSHITNGTSYTVSGLSDNTTYYWRVRAYDVVGNTNNGSSVWSVKVDTSQLIPTLYSPTNGSISSNTNPLFVWSLESGISSNQIMIWNASVTNTYTVSSNVTNYQESLNSLIEGMNYWKVRVYKTSTGEWQPFSFFYSYIVDRTAPTKPQLLNPMNNALVSSATQNLEWSPSSDAHSISHYIISISNNSGVMFYTNMTTNRSVVFLEGTNYWSVLAEDVAGNKSSRTDRMLIVDTTAPNIVSLVSPVSNSIVVNSAILFQWNTTIDENGVDGYVIEIDDDSGFGSINYSQTTNGTNVTLSLTNGTYYWRVRAYDVVGNTNNWSSVWIVSVDTAPPIVTYLSPVNGITLYTNSVNLSWTGSDISGVSNYIIQLSTNNFSTVFTNIIQTNSSIELELPLNLYYWRIIAQDVLGNVGTNSIYQFTMRPYQASAYDIQVSDGIHIVDIPESLDSPKGKIAINSVILISFKLQGDANSSSDIQVKYNINENAKNGTFVQAKWTGEEWVAELQGDSIDAQVGDVFYFKIISDGHIVENSGNTNGWGFEFGQIKDQENGVTIVNNAIRKESEDKVYIKYPITKKIKVSICVYNISGELVKKIVEEEQDSGIHIAEWDGTNIKNQSVGRGIYLIVVKTDGKEIRKVVIR